MANYTPEQQIAISARGKDLLVSAAAGSGKTTVLVERVLSMIDEGIPINRILIVTFTRAAASDMRAKLQRKLEERVSDNELYRKQLELLPYTVIGTLHSYCMSVIREFFEIAQIDPAFRIMDDIEKQKQIEQNLRIVLNEAFENKDEGLEQLGCGRSIASFIQMARELYDFSCNRPDPDGWLRESCEKAREYAYTQKCEEMLWEDCRSAVAEACTMYREAIEYARMPEGPMHYLPALENDLSQLTELYNCSPQECAVELPNFAQSRLSNKKFFGPYKEEVANLRKQVKSLFDGVKKSLIPAEDAYRDMCLTVPAMEKLCSIVLRLRELLEEERAEKCAYDYSDLEQRAIRVMENSEAAKIISERYDAVFVDEYQDISDLQETIIRMTARPGCLFMVGDVKQSIYRFRLAEPGLFLAKQEKYERNEEGLLIHLNKNFRSRHTILEFTNRVFDNAMNMAGSELKYTDDEALHPGASFEGNDPPVEIYVIKSKETEETEKDEEDEQETDKALREGMLIANRICELVGMMIYDPAIGEERALRYRDIVILARTRNRLQPIREVLESCGIPCFADISSGYTESMEIRHILSLLSVIDNSQKDQDLLAALLSPVIGFSPNEVAEIRIRHNDGSLYDACMAEAENNEALSRFFGRIKAWRLLSCNIRLKLFVRRVLRESGIYSYVGAMPGGERRQRNLDLLCDLASQYEEQHNTGLYGFLESFRMPKDGNDRGEAQILGENEDVVRLMTVHKSKGLEFPVVIGVQTERDFTRGGKSQELYAHKELGFSFQYRDPELRTRRETIAETAIKSKQRLETANEEMRLLYVMMTRASDRLILIGLDPDPEKKLDNTIYKKDNIRQLKSWLDMILQAGTQIEDGTVSIFSGDAVQSAVDPHIQNERNNLLERMDTLLSEREEKPKSLEGLSWIYPHWADTLSPTKLTVTALAHKEYEGPGQVPLFAEKPVFLGGFSRRALQRGTSTHTALSAINLTRLRDVPPSLLGKAFTEELDALLEKHILSKAEYEDVRRAECVCFLQSPLGQRLLHADEVHREWPFNMTMSPQEAFGPDAEGADFLVQGIIDCCFMENGEWILMDYKTDAGTDSMTLKERYTPQLRLYCRALESITGIPVAEAKLCLLHHNEQIEIDR